MKIAFIFGKGIDGCGVTKGAHLFEEWLYKNNHESIIVNFNNSRKYHRAALTTWKGKLYNVESDDILVSNEIIKAVNECDIVLFHSHPVKKQYLYVNRYLNFIKSVDQPIRVIYDHGITKSTINAIPNACEIMTYADVSIIQSIDGLAMKSYKNFDPYLENRFIENPIWLSPSSYDRFNLPFEEREKHFLYMGRMSPIKDPAMICRIEPYMKDWILSIIGVERSISSVDPNKPLDVSASPYRPEHRPKVLFHKNCKDYYFSKDKINAWQAYEYEWGMNQLGSSFASWNGYRLSDSKEYGSRMEYTMIESFLLTLPIISRDFAENAYSPEGKKWGDYGCALISGATHEEELAETLINLQNNKSEWNERTKACRDLIFKFNDIDILAKNFIDQILKLGKRKQRVDPLEVISRYFPEASQVISEGGVVVSNATSTMGKTQVVVKDGKYVKYEPKPTNPLTALFGI